MPSNKKRLYLTLHIRSGKAKMKGGEDAYHWSLLIGPKHETEDGKGTRYHAKEKISPSTHLSTWCFEETDCLLHGASAVLIRILIAKIKSPDRAVEILRKVPIRGKEVEGWNCVAWVRGALEGLVRDGNALGTCVRDWETVRNGAMGYVRRKKEEGRFEGRGGMDMRVTPTYDLVVGKEITP